MTRNPSEADPEIWMGTADATSNRGRRRQQREPLNWPTAALGIVALLVLAFAVWICGGVATEIWGS